TERRCSSQAASTAPTASQVAAGGTPRTPARTGTSRRASQVSWAGSPPPTTETARAASFTCRTDRPFRAAAGSRAGCESTRKVSSEETTQAGTRSEFGAATKTSTPTTTAAQVATDEPLASKTTMETPSTSWSSSPRSGETRVAPWSGARVTKIAPKATRAAGFSARQCSVSSFTRENRVSSFLNTVSASAPSSLCKRDQASVSASIQILTPLEADAGPQGYRN
ncbi:unnamed protein product, partial [Ixodes persulcatus]